MCLQIYSIVYIEQPTDGYNVNSVHMIGQFHTQFPILSFWFPPTDVPSFTNEIGPVYVRVNVPWDNNVDEN